MRWLCPKGVDTEAQEKFVASCLQEAEVVAARLATRVRCKSKSVPAAEDDFGWNPKCEGLMWNPKCEDADDC